MTRRFGLYSDIHGNAEALEAVFSDMAGRGVGERYCLGDLVGYGTGSSTVIAMVRESGDPVIRGNYDDGVGRRKGECGCYYGSPQAKLDGEASYRYTDESLDEAEHEYLAGLPDELRFEAAGVRVLLVHGSPRRINEYLLPDRTDKHLVKLAEQAAADVVCLGHVHLPYHRVVDLPGGGVAHFISDGSVGKPKDGDPRACWAEVVIGDETAVAEALAGEGSVAPCGEAWVGVRFNRVAYDVESVARSIVDAGLPLAFAEALRTG